MHNVLSSIKAICGLNLLFSLKVFSSSCFITTSTFCCQIKVKYSKSFFTCFVFPYSCNFIFCSCLFCLFISFFSHLKSWVVFSISMSLTLKISSFHKLGFSISIKPWTPFRLTLQDFSSNSSPKYSSTSISYWLKILRWTKILATISSSIEN